MRDRSRRPTPLTEIVKAVIKGALGIGRPDLADVAGLAINQDVAESTPWKSLGRCYVEVRELLRFRMAVFGAPLTKFRFAP